MISRIKTLFGAIVAVGLAVGTAGWESAYVAPPSDSNRRGRLEFRYDVAAAPAGEAADEQPDTPEQAAQPETPEQPATQPETPVEPEQPATPEAPPAEPDVVSITDVTLAVVENSELPHFKVANTVRLHLDMEGLVFWVTATKRTEMNSQTHVFRNVGSSANYNRPLLIIPDEFTNWQYVKDTLATADKAGTQEVYLGVADLENKTTLRLLRVMPSAPSDEAREGDFVINVKEGDGGPAISIDGEEITEFPTGLAFAWSEWRKAHPDADISFGPNSNVVVDAHRFTPTGYVAQVVGVLRGLGIGSERFVGSTSYAGRKRK